MKTFLALLLITSSALACPSNVQKVKTGTPANCDGWLVSDPTMQNMARNVEELEKSQKLVLAQEHLQKLSNDEIEHYKKRSANAEKALSQSEAQKFWLAAGAFALGVVLTGVAAKAAIESTR